MGISTKLVAAGNLLASIAERNGLNPFDRNVLQKLGQGLATRDPSAFVIGLLSNGRYDPPENVVFDGVRHVTVWRELEGVAARTKDFAFLVFLDMPEGVRLLRLDVRGLDRRMADAFDSHESESDLEARLRETADLILDARLEQDQLFERLFASRRQLVRARHHNRFERALDPTFIA